MRDQTNIDGAGRSSFDEAAVRVEIQRRVVSVIRDGDPGLAYANALLRQMEQSVAIAKINTALEQYDSPSRS